MRALLVTTDRLGLVLDDLLGPHGYTVERQLDPQRAELRAAGCALVLLEWDALGASAAAACRALAVASGATLVALRHDRSMATMAEALAAGANEVLCLPEGRDRPVARAQAAARTVKGRVDDAFLRHPLPSWIFDEQ